MHTTTFGVGELIAAALGESTVQRILLGVGGSVTCDGGIGMAQALGAHLLDGAGEEIASPATGADLEKLALLDCSDMDERLRGIDILVVCDVANPLLGAKGAAAVFAPRRGLLRTRCHGWSRVFARCRCCGSGRAVAGWRNWRVPARRAGWRPGWSHSAGRESCLGSS